MASIGKTYRCRLLNTTKGRKSAGSRVKEKTYGTGDIIVLKAVNVSKLPTSRALAFETNDGYILPSSVVIVIEEVMDKSQTAQAKVSQQVYDEAQIVGGGYSFANGQKPKIDFGFSEKKAKWAKGGALVGVVAGYIYAMKTNSNKLVFSGAGALLGGIVGSKLTK